MAREEIQHALVGFAQLGAVREHQAVVVVEVVAGVGGDHQALLDLGHHERGDFRRAGAALRRRGRRSEYRRRGERRGEKLREHGIPFRCPSPKTVPAELGIA
jgi:hypothetical protein